MIRVLQPSAVAAAAILLAAALPAQAAALRVFACEPEWAALAEEIGGENVTVYSATHGRQDAHHIRARPSLIARIRRADLLFCSGADLETGWLPILMQRGAPRAVQPGQPGHLMAAAHVEILEQPETLDRSQGDLHPEGNPHVHLDPRNILDLADELAKRLERIDPANAEAYRGRLGSFRNRWTDAMDGWRKRAARLAGMQVVVYHEAWVYLIRWAGLERAASLEPLPGIPPTAGDLARTLNRARSAEARIILRAPFEPTEAANWLSGKAGIPVLELPFTVGGQPGVDDLFDLFEKTLALLEGSGHRS